MCDSTFNLFETLLALLPTTARPMANCQHLHRHDWTGSRNGRCGGWHCAAVLSRERSGDIRSWARDQGIAVSDRGRIPANVIEQYHATAKAL